MTGTLLLTRLALRRDRVLVAIWLLLLVGVCYASAEATTSLYPSLAERVRAAEAINSSPSIVALYGPVVDVTSIGELAMTKLTVLYAVFVAVFMVVVIRRHTRTDEESGLTELVGGTAVRSTAPLAAAVLLGCGLSLVLGALAGLADLAGGLPLEGSLAFGASWAGVGLVSVGLTAIACQLSASSRTCAAFSAGAIAVLYAFRAVGDTSTGPLHALRWASPFGWSTQLRAWSEPRWWVLALYALTAVGLITSAALVRGRRDLGSGLVAERTGPAQASPRLRSVLAVTVRGHRASLLIWTVAVAALSVFFGTVAPDISDMLDSSSAREMIERLGGVGVIQETLLAAELSVSAVVLTCFGISVIAQAGEDERSGRTDELMAAEGSRGAIIGSHLVVALAGSLWLLVVTGVCMGVGFGAEEGTLTSSVRSLVAAALGQAPAVCLVVLLTAVAWSWRCTWHHVGWVFLAAFVTVGQLGELLRLPDWVVNLSPYSHAPAMPVEPFDPAAATALLALGVVALTAAVARFRVRDLG
ncbi:ABC transporter permease [Aeromicrobium terrae]|uniref:ABC transporter permease n=1 Tax=Aeromicrobium terrae TaxID=2498846 RepID=A0A5C8NFB0_9ACTN|nr:hypothetical protein [Aeromicrobium terrae]TXL57495.1 hypothetical protein FHP06_14065 [Aeromicrobium terrae]